MEESETKPLRVAVVGCGQISHTAHIPNFSQSPDVDLVAVADKDRGRADQCSRTFNVPQAFDSFEEMLQTMHIDAVSICVPNKFHAPYAISALEHGCHVLCEKPPAMTADEVSTMAKTAEKAGKVLTFGLHYRFSAEVETIKRFADNEEFGTIHAAKAVALRRRGIPGWGDYGSKVLQGGGPLMDIGVHVLDAALWLMGYPEPRSVLATTHHGIGTREGVGELGSWDWHNHSVEDMARGMVQFTNGASLLLETSFAANLGEQERMEVSVMGDHGGADVLPPRIYQERHGVLIDTVPVHPTPYGVAECYSRQIQDFIRCCVEGGETLVPTGEAIALQRIVDALYLSAQTQRTVELGTVEDRPDGHSASPLGSQDLPSDPTSSRKVS